MTIKTFNNDNKMEIVTDLSILHFYIKHLDLDLDLDLATLKSKNTKTPIFGNYLFKSSKKVQCIIFPLNRNF
jgi:hypothetical protein